MGGKAGNTLPTVVSYSVGLGVVRLDGKQRLADMVGIAIKESEQKRRLIRGPGGQNSEQDMTDRDPGFPEPKPLVGGALENLLRSVGET